jgi:putative DNA methylase
MQRVPRLIEVDFPFRQVSDACAAGRTAARGSITPVHLWWARKPLAACRASVLAALLPDAGSELCTDAFREHCVRVLSSVGAWSNGASPSPLTVREALSSFVATLAFWVPQDGAAFLDAARELVALARPMLSEGGSEEWRMVDPFAGGGAFPLEAARLGCHAHASDLNPVAATIERATLDLAPRHGPALLEAVSAAAEEVHRTAFEALGQFYPCPNGSRRVAYLWFRTAACEGPGCGATIPLTSKFTLRRAASKSVGLRLSGWKDDTPLFEVATGAVQTFPAPTVRRGDATCMKCGFVLPVQRVRAQLCASRAGLANPLPVATVSVDAGRTVFEEPSQIDLSAAAACAEALRRAEAQPGWDLPFAPSEPLPPIGTLGFRVQRYGVLHWRDLFTCRQLLFLGTVARLIRFVREDDRVPGGLGEATRTCLALALDRVADYMNTGCSWNPSGGSLPHLFTRQALPIIWDFAEANPFGGSSGDWLAAVEHVVLGLRNAMAYGKVSSVSQCSATNLPLPSASVDLIATDPPYYDAIPYSDLSEFFYVWLRRSLGSDRPAFVEAVHVPRDDECIVNPVLGKDSSYFRDRMRRALAEARRAVTPDGLAVVVFAHRSTVGWEDLLTALVDAGWVVTASWPVSTENMKRLRARNSAALASSVHLVCRPRSTGTMVGTWRAVLAELPVRIHDWLPRMMVEGISGADAIFACLGPALEIFTRYDRVEKVSGEIVDLKRYLEEVWAAIAREALSVVLDGVDASGLEEDARLSAMWLWTVGAPASGASQEAPADEVDDGMEGSGDSEDPGNTRKLAGYTLEFDAARKIAQGLGAHLEKLTYVVEVKGDKARLLAVSERVEHLFGRDERAEDAPKRKKAKKTSKGQLGLFAEIEAAERQGLVGSGNLPKVGETTLDRVHQSMILFGAGRSEALKRFIVEEGVGKDGRFWKLAQSLSALYPSVSEEKRWVDGVLARKKGLGF